MLNRRELSIGACALTIAACTQTSSAKEKDMTDGATNIDWDKLSETDWKARLTDMEFRVSRGDGLIGWSCCRSVFGSVFRSLFGSVPWSVSRSVFQSVFGSVFGSVCW